MVDKFKLIYPVGTGWLVSQTFDEHVLQARIHGWCTKPGSCPSAIYYYGGIDWACPIGTFVYSAASGEVIAVVTSNIGYGNHVKIHHTNGMITVYGHNSTLLAKVGEHVRVGDLIAYSGSSGNSSGPHIHFELRDAKGVPIDPMPYLTDSIPGSDDDDVTTELPTEFPVEATMIGTPAIRLSPELSNNDVGRMKLTNKVKVLEILDEDTSLVTWTKVELWVAYKQGKNIFMEFKKG